MMQVRLAQGGDRGALIQLDGGRCAGFGRLGVEVHELSDWLGGPAGTGTAVLVLEDARQALCGYALLGTPAVAAHFRRGLCVRRVPFAGIERALPTLSLVNDLTGAGQLHALRVGGGVEPSAGAAQLLAACQTLASAEPDRFGRRLFATLPGVRDDSGDSLLWQALGRHFAVQGSDFMATDGALLAELLPQHTLFSGFLPEPARAALGEVGDAHLDAQEWLRAALWQESDYVDPFDGGPVLVLPSQGAGR
ncbi:arginine N-succinyltransferase [Crenobacter intestini]|uniref:Arginine N-succinyltransferase n=1 Tax=Crenobacter intestini TaxID=2563443 RepID=A0A4T0UMX8_9NEIS|nr:arginine N-succinyltransferase [Crenobacter intestini]TIC79836.1 arginine N-succinyltransferase [Crenobacter intestini]